MLSTPQRAWLIWLGAVLTAWALSGCGARGLIRSELAGAQADGPRRVLVVPPDFVISEITFGKTQERVVPAERHAAQVLTQHITELGQAQKGFELTTFDSLGPDQQKLTLQHRALFATMVSQLLLIKEEAIDAWQDKVRYFDYSLGLGMAELAQQQHIDTAIFIIGKDTVRSTSRKVLDTITAILPLGESLNPQSAVVVLGVVNLRSGAVLMFDSEVAARKALTDDDDVRALGNAVLQDFKRSIKDRSGTH